MATTQRIAKTRASKGRKPHPDFPLFPHASGRWAKKVKGKFAYFGKVVDDPRGEAALQLWLKDRDELLAGRVPRSRIVGGPTVRDVVNQFLTSKKRSLEAREISSRTFSDYHTTCGRIVKAMGKDRPASDLTAEDFEKYRARLARRWGPVRIANEVQRVRTLFKYAFECDLLEKPVKFGPAFKKPSRRAIRLARADKGPRLFEAPQLRQLLRDASPQVKAMLLLGSNCGLGNADCGNLQHRHLDLKGGWLNYPRPKTGIERRCPLWPETVKALQEAIEKRPKPKSRDHLNLVFITKYGEPWAKDVADSPITKETDKLLVAAGMKRPGLSFYTLRHTFATVAGESRDQVAVDHIMGHARDDMASVYRERISDERLKAVSEHVRKWLWPAKGRAKKEKAG
jgi:integrase